MNICKQNHWHKVFKITGDNPILELFFWKKNIRNINDRYVLEYSLPQMVLYSDASHSGCGAWAKGSSDDESAETLKFNQAWLANDRSKSSTWREVKGVQLALRAFAPK